VPPGLLLGVVDLSTGTAARRAGKGAAARKVDPDIELVLLPRESNLNYLPGGRDPQGRHEYDVLIHWMEDLL